MDLHPLDPYEEPAVFLDEYYERAPDRYRPRYIPSSALEWLRLLAKDPTFFLPKPSILFARLAHSCIMALPWPDEFRDRLDTARAYEEGYQRALDDTGKKSELARLRYYRRCRISLLQLVRVIDDVDKMPNTENMDDYEMCLDAAKTALEESNRVSPRQYLRPKGSWWDR